MNVQNFGSRTDTVFCGVFDGHGPYGHLVAKRVRDSLPLKLSAHWEVNIKTDDVLREVSLNTSSMCSEDASFLSHEEESRASIDIEETGKQPDIFPTLKESFLKAYKVMDRELRMHANIDCYCSGTTAVTLVKQVCLRKLLIMIFDTLGVFEHSSIIFCRVKTLLLEISGTLEPY